MESDPPMVTPANAALTPSPPGFGHSLRQPSLRLKLWSGFGGLLLILLLVSGLSVMVLRHYSHTLERIFRDNYDSVTYCDAMKQSLDEVNVSAQRVVFNESLPTPEMFDAASERFTRNAEGQRRNSYLPGEQTKTEAVLVGWVRYRSECARFAAASAASRSDIYRESLLPQNHDLRAQVDEISAMNLTNMTAVDGRVRTTISTVQNTLIALAVIGLTIAGLFVLAIGPRMLRPLSALTRSAQEIADGRLDLAVPVRTEDEVGQLAQAFNVMAARLRVARDRDRDRLARTEQTTQMAIDSLPDAVIVLNAVGGIELANRAAVEQFVLRPGDERAALPDYLSSLRDEVLRNGEPSAPSGYRSAIQKFWKGEERFFLPHAVPLINAAGRTVGVTVVLADVTRLKQADEAKSDLVSTVSHELRTPLTSIRMAVHMMVDGTFGELSAQQAQLLTTACENADRLHRILENLLNISRMESGRAPLTFENIPVRQIIEMSVAPLRESFAGANVALVLPDNLLPDVNVRADLSCIGHVLTNLLTNALRHTAGGGTVTIKCDPSTPTAEHVRFTVMDDGVGIAAHHLPHLFEKFFRVAASSSKSAGAGLGLAIAKEIVDAHGGTIWADSESARGATFSFTLLTSGPRD